MNNSLAQMMRCITRVSKRGISRMALPKASALCMLLAILCPVSTIAGEKPEPKLAAVHATDIPRGGSVPTPPRVPVFAHASSLTLSPAVIMMNGLPGLSTTRELTISNLTPSAFEFEMQALDVEVREGKRVFVPAGELPGSIARTAVFSPSTLVVKPGADATVRVTVTIPENMACRAMVAIFRSRTKLQGHSAMAMTASIGTLLTFTVSKNFEINSEGLQFDGASEGSDLVVSEWVKNGGSEPVVSKGVVAVLDSAGKLVGKVPVDSQRLLPGERLQFKADYPTTLKRGKYRALISLEHDGGVLTTSSEFSIQ